MLFDIDNEIVVYSWVGHAPYPFMNLWNLLDVNISGAVKIPLIVPNTEQGLMIKGFALVNHPSLPVIVIEPDQPLYSRKLYGSQTFECLTACMIPMHEISIHRDINLIPHFLYHPLHK